MELQTLNPQNFNKLIQVITNPSYAIPLRAGSHRVIGYVLNKVPDGAAVVQFFVGFFFPARTLLVLDMR